MKIGYLLVLFFLCYTSFAQTDEYKAAINTNTVEAYYEFLDNFPDSKYEKKILEKISQLEQRTYLDALNKNNIEGYKSFLSDFPRSSKAGIIQQKIETIEYQSIQNDTIIGNLENYLILYPKSKYCSSISERIDYLIAVRSSDFDQLYKFLNNSNDSCYHNEIHDILFKKLSKSKNIGELQKYIDNYPSSDYVPELEEKLNYLKSIVKLEENLENIDYSQIQVIINAYVSGDLEVSANNIILNIELDDIVDVIWKSYTRLLIATNFEASYESVFLLKAVFLSAQIRMGKRMTQKYFDLLFETDSISKNAREEIYLNWYQDIMNHVIFADSLMNGRSSEKAIEMGKKIYASIKYGEDFLHKNVNIDDSSTYILQFDSIMNELNISHEMLNLPLDSVIESQFSHFNNRILSNIDFKETR